MGTPIVLSFIINDRCRPSDTVRLSLEPDTHLALFNGNLGLWLTG